MVRTGGDPRSSKGGGSLPGGCHGVLAYPLRPRHRAAAMVWLLPVPKPALRVLVPVPPASSSCPQVHTVPHGLCRAAKLQAANSTLTRLSNVLSHGQGGRLLGRCSMRRVRRHLHGLQRCACLRLFLLLHVHAPPSHCPSPCRVLDADSCLGPALIWHTRLLPPAAPLQNAVLLLVWFWTTASASCGPCWRQVRPPRAPACSAPPRRCSYREHRLSMCAALWRGSRCVAVQPRPAACPCLPFPKLTC